MAARERDAVDDKQDDGSENGYNPSRRLSGPVKSRCLPDKIPQKHPADAQKNRHDKPARITAGHEEFGDHSDNQAGDNQDE